MAITQQQNKAKQIPESLSAGLGGCSLGGRIRRCSIAGRALAFALALGIGFGLALALALA